MVFVSLQQIILLGEGHEVSTINLTEHLRNQYSGFHLCLNMHVEVYGLFFSLLSTQKLWHTQTIYRQNLQVCLCQKNPSTWKFSPKNKYQKTDHTTTLHQPLHYNVFHLEHLKHYYTNDHNNN